MIRPRLRYVRKIPLRFVNPYYTAGVSKIPLFTFIQTLPTGARSAEEYQEKWDLQRKAEKERAKILGADEAKFYSVKRLEEERKKEKEKEENYKMIDKLIEHKVLNAVPPEYQEEYNKYKQKQKDKDKKGSGIISTPSQGWQAYMLHQLLKPWEMRKTVTSPKEQVREQEDEIDDRQNVYREQETNLRGKEPSNEKVREAMPSLAAPLFNAGDAEGKAQIQALFSNMF